MSAGSSRQRPARIARAYSKIEFAASWCRCISSRVRTSCSNDTLPTRSTEPTASIWLRSMRLLSMKVPLVEFRSVTRSWSAASSTWQCARETPAPGTMISAGAVSADLQPGRSDDEAGFLILSVEPLGGNGPCRLRALRNSSDRLKNSASSASVAVGLASSVSRALPTRSSAVISSSGRRERSPLRRCELAASAGAGAHQPVVAGLATGAATDVRSQLAVLCGSTSRRKSLTSVCQRRVGRVAGPVRKVGGVGQFENDRQVAGLDDRPAPACCRDRQELLPRGPSATRPSAATTGRPRPWLPAIRVRSLHRMSRPSEAPRPTRR